MDFGVVKLRITLCLFTFLFSVGLSAASPSYPEAVVKYLDEQLPKMDAAVLANNRDYFEKATIQLDDFLSVWVLGNKPKLYLEKYPYCTDAVTDHLIVGLCKIMPPGSICEPATFFPKFENNLKSCRAAALRLKN